MTETEDIIPCRYWQPIGEGTVQCKLCPHSCRIKEGGNGLCFVRRNVGGRLQLRSGHRVSSIAFDPVEKKPLYHFLPGTLTLSLGGIGCNFSCRFCQNAVISQQESELLLDQSLTGEAAIRLARVHRAPSVSFTYNEPVVALEFVAEIAAACRAAGLKTIAVTNGYIAGEARAEFFGLMDAANVDLKAFTDDFYRKFCGARLGPVMETLVYLRRETKVWLEVTTLLIPGANDSDNEIHAMTQWAVKELGAEVPWHFSAFYPQYRMTDRPPTSPETLERARDIALRNGLRYVYVGNVFSEYGQTTFCPSCGARLIERAGLRMQRKSLRDDGTCPQCNARCAGVFATK